MIKHLYFIVQHTPDFYTNNKYFQLTQADAVENISKQIQNQLRLLAQRGSVVAQLPDAHKIIEWRQKIGTGKVLYSSRSPQSKIVEAMLNLRTTLCAQRVEIKFCLSVNNLVLQ